MPRYPHNRYGMPVRPLRRWEERKGHAGTPADPTWAFHQAHVWLEGQDSTSVAFIDVAWSAP